MNAVPDPALLERLEAFELDDPEAVFPFTARLARENGWTRDFARRVVVEYKRFVYLAMTAGHPVSPSEEVDQAWHLHLVYTRSYWDGMCGKVLGRPLHHGPTTGGREEGEKFAGWHARTLQSYFAIFGQSPPVDIWPDPETESARAGNARRVDVSRFWILPRPRFPRTGGARRPPRVRSGVPLLAGLGILAAAGGWTAWMHGGSSLADAVTQRAELPGTLFIFNWSAGPFLVFYIVALILAALLSFALQQRETERALPVETSAEPELTDVYEQAMLSGGECRVAQTALVSLILSGALTVKRTLLRRVMLEKAGGPPEHPVERAFYEMAARNGPTPVHDLCRRIPAYHIRRQLTDRLVRAGLLPEPNQRPVWKAAVPLLIMLTIGVIRLIAGFERGKPVGFLVVLLIVTGILCFLATRRKLLRLPLGERVLSRLRQNLPSARDQPSAVFALQGPQVLTSLAVPVILADAFRQAQQRQQQEAGGNSGGGCGASSGCGSSGEGGGGGCGGCGGGGGD
ncbi:MAG: TIGR04222 domain-containing membrane protein [Verrucomicrobiota bacterium]